MTTYTLLQGLIRMDALRRARLARVECRWGTAPFVTGFLHPSVGAEPFMGPVTASVPLEEQIDQLRRCGLWGEVGVEEISTPGSATGDAAAVAEGERVVEVRFWSAIGERMDWTRRVEASLASPVGEELLIAFADLALATWQREVALERVQRALWVADSIEPRDFKRNDLPALAGVSRQKAYRIFDEKPEGFDASAVLAALRASHEQTAAPSLLPSVAPGRPVTAATPTAAPVTGSPGAAATTHPGASYAPSAAEDPASSAASSPVSSGGEVVRRRRVLDRVLSQDAADIIEGELIDAATTAAGSEAASAATSAGAGVGVSGAGRGGVLVSLGGVDPRAVLMSAEEQAVSSAPLSEKARQLEASRKAFNAAAAQRFCGIAAAMDEDFVYLPDGSKHVWSVEEVPHLGALVDLARRYRLGWGGGARMPDWGEVWLYPGALERFGLPVFLEGGEGIEGEAARREAEAIELKILSSLPPVQAARDAGYEIGDDGRVSQRTKVRLPDSTEGVFVVVPSWAPQLASIDLLTDLFPASAFTDDDTAGEDLAEATGETSEEAVEDGAEGDDGLVRDLVDPQVLVDRLQTWVEWVRVPFRVSPAMTGLALVDHTRPPRRSRFETRHELVAGTASMRSRGGKAGTVAVVRGERPDLPDFKAGRRPRFNTVEGNISWWRPFTSLTDSERGMTYVHAYDHRSHYLNPWHSTFLGVEGLVYRSGQDAVWDERETPAYYLVSEWEWEDWTMPDPGLGSSAFVQAPEGQPRRRWVTPHTLRQLNKLSPGFTNTLEFHESYSWAVTAKYLDIAGGILREARNRGPEVIRGTVKATYAGAIGKMHALNHRDDYHLHRPDWTDMIQGAARTAVVAILDDIRATSGATPLVVDRDTIVYASNTPDPWEAWPGPAAKLGALAGGWRPIGSARLDQWGPTALPSRKGRPSWSYARHTATLTPPPAQPTVQVDGQPGRGAS